MNSETRGFTLIELIVTLSLLAVIMALAAPTFREIYLNNRQAAELNELMAALNMARAEAVKRGSDTVLCIHDGNSPPACRGGTAWENGWFLFADDDGDGVFDSGVEVLVLNGEALGDNLTFQGDGGAVRYNPRGSTGNAGTFVLCDDRGYTEARGIVLAGSGRARQAIDSDDDGVLEDGGGNDFTSSDCP